MKRTIKFLIGVIFLSGTLHAVQDRFGSERRELPRSSFTDTIDLNVAIATVTEPTVLFSTTNPFSGGSLTVKSVIFSGMNPSTITFYDDTQFNQFSTTRTRLEYTPQIDGRPVQVNVDLFMSSGIIYNKTGIAPVEIQWDWNSPRRRGDPRK